jgi:hypothetical protein
MPSLIMDVVADGGMSIDISGGSQRGAGMTSGSDDLERELRKNLKLRRELGAEAAKGKAALSAKLGGGIA